VLTSNKTFDAWGETFGDEVMATALIDRLVHHCHIVNIRGNSYRMKNQAEFNNARRTPPRLRPNGPHAGRPTRSKGSPPCAPPTSHSPALSDPRTGALHHWRACRISVSVHPAYRWRST
jgi:hypothetical protein